MIFFGCFATDVTWDQSFGPKKRAESCLCEKKVVSVSVSVVVSPGSFFVSFVPKSGNSRRQAKVKKTTLSLFFAAN